MMESDFKASFEAVASAFGAKPDEGRMFVYLKTFRHLTDKQWQVMCDWAVQSCDRFPTVKDLIRGTYECGMVQRPKSADLDKGVMTVVCTCGASFVFHRNAQPSTYQCPGDTCHVSFDSEYVIRNADQYGVLWMDQETREALKAKIPKAHAMKAVYEYLKGMHRAEPVQVRRADRVQDIGRALPKEAFAKSFDGTDPRPSPAA